MGRFLLFCVLSWVVFCYFVCPCGTFSVVLCVLVGRFLLCVLGGSFSVVSCVLVGRFLLFCVPLWVVFCYFVCPCGSFSVVLCVLVGRFLLFCVSLWVVLDRSSF